MQLHDNPGDFKVATYDPEKALGRKLIGVTRIAVI